MSESPSVKERWDCAARLAVSIVVLRSVGVGGSVEGIEGVTVRWARDGEDALGPDGADGDAGLEVFGAVEDVGARTLRVANAEGMGEHEKLREEGIR